MYYANGVTISEDDRIAYVADGYGLQIVDVSDISAPTILSTVYVNDWTEAIVLSADGSKVFITDNYAGVHIVDVSNSSAPYIMDTIPIEWGGLGTYWLLKTV